jgi:predicted nucleic acid-binding protein
LTRIKEQEADRKGEILINDIEPGTVQHSRYRTGNPKGEISANEVKPQPLIKPAAEAPRRFVLDSFAVFAYLNDEEGADQVEEILKGARTGEMEVYIHVVNLGEIFYLTMRQEDETAAYKVYGTVRRYPVTFIDDLSEDLLLTAGRLKAKNSIAYADTFAAATAKLKDATLVTGDPEFKPLEEEIDILWIKAVG